MPVLIEAALRSLLVGLVVALGLRLFRVRNVLVQKAAWGLVLVTALAMPLLQPVAARLLPASATLALPAHPMTLLEELQARIQAKSASGRPAMPATSPAPQANPPRAKESPSPSPTPAPTRHAAKHSSVSLHAAYTSAPVELTTYSPPTSIATTLPASPAPRRALSLSAWAFLLYFAVAATLLLKLAFGLSATMRLWQTATPVPAHRLPAFAASLRARASTRVSSPVTLGSAILLPADYKTWDYEKLRIVLAHEGSHIRQGDFYLQLLANFYAALVWFSPLGWWLKHELADLAEAISDRAGIEAAHSRTTYAQVLLEFAAAPRPAAIGVAMARPGSLSRRIERLLNDHAFRQAFAGSRRALVAVVLVPLATFAATAMVRVQAAPLAQSASHAAAAHFAVSSSTASASMPQAELADPVQQLDLESSSSDDLAISASADSETSAASPEPQAPVVSNEIAALVPPALPVHIRAIAREAAQSDDGPSFDRTLSVSGSPQLTVLTGSGDIEFARNSGNEIHIHARIRVSRDGSEEEAREIAANPPIEQNGNVIRIGRREENWHGISINYQIEAPAGTLLGATSGSGNIVDQGVGQNAKLETGSGDIKAVGLHGGFYVQTGSGNIIAEQTGEGDAKAETGSGDIEIKDIHGSFRAETGSGDIKAWGTPSSPWSLETGSGNIEVWSGNAPLTLDASTGSGSVTTEHEMLVKGSLDEHHIVGNLNGGGPKVRLQTGSGDIHIH